MSTQFNYNRFHNILLIKKLVMIFYDNEKASLKHQSHIQFLFRKIISETVILIAIEIHHCFVEYQHDIKKQTIKFEDSIIKNETFLNHYILKYRSLTIIIQQKHTIEF